MCCILQGFMSFAHRIFPSGGDLSIFLAWWNRCMRPEAQTWAGRRGGRQSAGGTASPLMPPRWGGGAARAAEFVTRIQEPVANLQRHPREPGRE